MHPTTNPRAIGRLLGYGQNTARLGFPCYIPLLNMVPGRKSKEFNQGLLELQDGRLILMLKLAEADFSGFNLGTKS